ncbi:Crp/Fnr family transcriptional regulator [Actibacterium sp. 188UL27-1]|uniref:Crp/Fnr family transcriptional regulator n=1 Tax=Actibacterium sp. 188UL27-1 TaxID=2786961 RepID=UPI00195A717B|nr:Crp/Fnr family transcriptional regulator [Actibacterium sp. 188UL27-1]MBM7069921.1 Crp/Fnr family transcriptional regulator [Actibacterium sp. 188UL27-1]
MQRFKTGEMIVDPGTQLLMEGAKAAQLYTVLSGMGIRYKTLENGRRQVIGFVMPGDFVGLQAGIMGEMCHSVEASTPMRLCVFNRSRVYELYQSQPERAYALTYLAAVEEHFLGDALATVGQRSASEKIAWSLARFYARAASLDLVTKNKCPLPFRQQDLADALGLSLVHTNKTLAKLKRDGIVVWTNGELEVHNLAELQKLSGIGDDTAAPRPLI